MSIARSNRITWFLAGIMGRLAPESMARHLQNPVFFIGCGRSGTTILSGLLSYHPQLAVYPTEANDLWHPHTYPWHRSEIDTPPFWYDAIMFTQLSLAARQSGDDKRLKGMFGAFQLLDGGKIFLNKSVMVTFMVPYILDLFPNARFIHVIRDGRAVASSYALKEIEKHKKYSKYDEMGFNFPMQSLLEKFADHWQEHILEIERQKKQFQNLKPDNLLELHYEDFCHEPSKYIDCIADFLKVSLKLFDYSQLQSVKNMNYKYKDRLDPESIESLTKQIAPALNLCGYSI